MSYVLELRKDGTALGGAFLLSRKWVVTAHHCVRRIQDGEEFDLVCVESGTVLRGSVEARDRQRDLAIIEVVGGSTRGRVIPVKAPATQGASWGSGYRPAKNMPYLQGDVQIPHVEFQTAGGGTITHGIQLRVDSSDGTFKGYSGSPVEKYETDEKSIIGVLVEQNPNRIDPARATGILWAAAIEECIDAFGFVLEETFEKILSSRGAKTESPEARKARIRQRIETSVRDRAAAYAVLQELSTDPNLMESVADMRAQISKTVMEWGGDR